MRTVLLLGMLIVAASALPGARADSVWDIVYSTPVEPGPVPALCLDQLPPVDFSGSCQGRIPGIVVCPFGADGIVIVTTGDDISIPTPCRQFFG